MLAFARLYRQLEEATTPARVRQVLQVYWAAATAEDAAWGVYLLAGGKQRRAVSAAELQAAACQSANVPDWLWAQCLEVVGDVAEAVALVYATTHKPDNHLDNNTKVSPTLSDLLERVLPSLSRTKDVPARRAGLLALWASSPAESHWVLNKLLTATIRQRLPLRVLAETLAESPHNVAGVPSGVLAQRAAALSGGGPAGAAALWAAARPPELAVLPQTHAPPAEKRDTAPKTLSHYAVLPWPEGTTEVQLVWREGHLGLWSQAGDWLAHSPPTWLATVQQQTQTLPDDTVLLGHAPQADGATLAYHDVLRWAGNDQQTQPLAHRLKLLEAQLGDKAADYLSADELDRNAMWAQMPRHTPARLRKLTASYPPPEASPDVLLGPPPNNIKALLAYAQRADGPLDHYVEYTLALWRGPDLVPIAKLPAHLPIEQVAYINRYIKANTLQRYGPVRTVKAELVLELSFEGLAASSRHKSGLVLRGAQLVRLLEDATPQDADSLQTVLDLLPK